MSETRYTKEHQWIKVEEGGTAYVGITAFAADELGTITYIELPSEGETFQQNAQLCVVESVKAASDVFMPVSGTVAEVNAQLEKNPGLLNDSAEEAAWICRVENFDKVQFEGLMTAAQYSDFTKN